MGESFLRALGVVLPIAIMLLCGALLRKGGYIGPGFVDSANRVIFHLFIPVSIFESCYTGQLHSPGSGRMVVFCCVCVLLMFLVYIPIAKWTDPVDSRRSVILQASFRGNLALFGFPVLSLMYDKSQLGPMAILMAFMIPELNVLAVLCFEMFSGKKANIAKALLRIIKNPLIIAIVVGTCMNLCSVSLPAPVLTTVESLGAVTTPLAFVVLGASFSFASAKKNRKALAVALSGKLIVLPLIALGTGVAMGLRGPLLASAMALFGTPVAVSSAAMASEMGGDGELASEAVVVSTVLAVFTMFLWIFIMSLFGLL